MKKLDEFELIKEFQASFGNRKFISEDVETFSLGGVKIVAKVDTLVQSTDIPLKMTLKDATRKSIVACVSDFASKGVKPRFGIISINLPQNISTKEAKSISDSIRSTSKEFGIRFLGGDTNQGKEIVFHVCIFGTTDKIVRRNGAKIGDLIFVTGPFGYTAAGLEILIKKIKTDNYFAKKSIKSVLKPNPRLTFGLEGKKYFSSSMDSSDGLSTTLNEMAKQSRCKFMIKKLPTKKEVRQFCKIYKKNIESCVFHAGEEYEIVFTIPKKYQSKITKIANTTKTPIIEIGQVQTGNGVFMEYSKGLVKLEDLGYHHFKR